MDITQVDRLKRSIQEWNKWREENWTVKPDLSGADFRGFNLFGANLDDVDLSYADFSGANLLNVLARHANLESANLENAKLQGANFSYANMVNGNLRKSNLTGAILQGAVLVEADLTEADCTGANFKEANLLQTIFDFAVVKDANFADSNVQEAQLYSDQFKEANVPFYALSRIEKKKKSHFSYMIFATFAVLFILALIAFNQFVMKSETPGLPTTKIRGSMYRNMAGVYEALGNEQKAINYLKKAITYNPEDPQSYYMLGSIHRRNKDVPEAIKYYKLFVELRPKSQEAGKINYYIQYHSARIRKKNEKEN